MGLERIPLLGMVMGCLLGVYCAQEALSTFWLGLLALPLFCAVRGKAWKTTLLLAAWVFFWGVHAKRINGQKELFILLENGSLGAQVLEGVITKRLDREGGSPSVWLRIEEGTWKGAKIGLVGSTLPDFLPGDRVRVNGRLFLPARASNPGERERRQALQRLGLAGEMWVEDWSISKNAAWAYGLKRVSWKWRFVVAERVTAGLDPGSEQALLIRALVLGDRSGGSQDLYLPFRRTGTMHVFAVSGLHVGLVGLLGWLVVRLLFLPRRVGLWFVTLLMWVYAMLTGLEPPAFRAAAMGTFLLLGFVFKRQSSVTNSLFASVPVVLLMDSFQWNSLGFQLSYVVVVFISLLGSCLTRLLQPWVEEDAFLPRVLLTKRQEVCRMLREKVAGLAAVSSAAWLGSLSLMRVYFGVITPVAIPASMLLVPLVFVILFLAMVGFVSGLFLPRVGEKVNVVNGGLVNVAYHSMKGASALPGGQLSFARHSWGKESLLVFSLEGGGAAAHLDVGGGVLIDAGSREDFFRVVRPALRSGRFFPDAMVLTHPDAAHIGGAVPVLEEWDVKQVLLPADWARSPYYKELLEYGNSREVRLVTAFLNQVYELEEGLWLEVLYVPDAHEDRVADERCLVCRLHWQGWKILFTGDAGFVTEKELLEKGVDVSADAWVMGRHDSDFTGTYEFVQAVNPQVIVTSHQGFPKHERVPARWAQLVRESGIELWKLSETGAVEISANEKELQLRSFLRSEQERVLKR